MEFQALDKWLDDWKIARIEYFNKLKIAFKTWNIAYSEAFNNHSERIDLQFNDWNLIKGYYTKTVKAISVIINNKKYIDYNYQHPGKIKYLEDCGFYNIPKCDVQFVEYNNRDERIKKIEKEIDIKREIIIAKVKKICTENIVDVAESIYNDGIYIRGVNGNVAHMWAVFAGGYNVQCLHIRVLVKETKWFEEVI